MKWEDITWDKVLMEAPGDEEPAADDGGLTATDYSNPDDVEVSEAGEDELNATDYTAEEEPAEGEEIPEGEEGMEGEEGLEGEEGIEGEEGMGDETTDETPDEEQNDNTSGDALQNKYLIQDFIELYTRTEEILEKVRTDKKMNSYVNPTYRQIKDNLEKLSKVTYDYIADRFSHETYISNLYQFNLIIQALNINVQMIENIHEKRTKANEKDKKGKKK